MAKQYKVIVNTGNTDNNKTVDVQQGAGDRGQPIRIKAQAGAKYQLQELTRSKPVGPDYVKVKRVGKDLHILFENETQASLILEDYYSEMAAGYNGVIGQAENGNFYEYIPEDPRVPGLIPELADGRNAVNVALGGAEVTPAGAAVAVAAFPLLGALGILGAGAAVVAATNDTNTGGTTPVNVKGALDPNAVNADGTPNDSGTKGDNRTNDHTPTLSGTVPAGSTATITINGQTYPVTVAPDGSWRFTQPTNLPDGTYTPKLNVTQNGVTTSADLTPFTIESTSTPVDTTAPTIAISADKTQLAAGQTSVVTFTLSEPSTDFALNDVTVIGGTLSNFQGSGTSYTATFTPNAGATSAAIYVASDRFSDAAGNLNKDGADTNNGWSYAIGSQPVPPVDTTPPTISVTADKNQLSAGQTSVVTFTLSEPSTDFALNDVTVIGGTLSNFQGSGTSYTATFTPNAGATSAAIYVASDKFSDAAGNLNKDGADTNNGWSYAIGPVQPEPVIDTTPPTIAITSSASQLLTGQTATITFTLSEASSDFALGDVTVNGGTLSNFQRSNTNPLVYTATLTPGAAATSVGIAVGNDRFSDAAGNVNKDGADTNNATSLTVTCEPIPTTPDLVGPTVAIARTGSGVLGGNTSEVITFTLSEASSTFSLADVRVTGGTLSNFQQSSSNPLVYSAVFSPVSGSKGQAYIGVLAGQFTDEMGNLNTDTFVQGTRYQADNLVTLDIDTALVSARGPFTTLAGTTVSPLLANAQSLAITALQHYMGQANALTDLFPTFNGTLVAPDNAWTTAANSFLSDFQAGTATVRIELRPSLELYNAQGAYSPTGTSGQPTIYLNADWLATNPSVAAIERVLLEEYGHYIDKRINPIDTLGDEGELFSYKVLGQTLTTGQIDAIRMEDDRLMLTLDGQPLLVEMASLLFAREAYFTTAQISLEMNTSTLGTAVAPAGSKYLFVSDPESTATYSGNNVRGWLYAVDASNNVIGSYYGEISRLIKIGSATIGCQFYVYPNPAVPSTGTVATTIVFGVDTRFDNAYGTGSVVKTSSDPVATALNALITPNQAPTAAPDANTASMPSCSVSGQVLANATGTVIANDTDPDTQYTINNGKMVPKPGSGLTVTSVTSSALGTSAAVAASTTSGTGSAVVAKYGTLTIGADGSYVYDVNELSPALIALPQGSTVSEAFTYTISDGKGGTASSTLTITISGGNNAPTAVNDFQAVNEVSINAMQASGTVKPNDSDPDTGDSFSVVSASSGQILSGTPTTINATGGSLISGTVTYTYASATFQSGQQSYLPGFEVYKNGLATGIFVATVNGKTVTFKDSAGMQAFLAVTTADTITFVSGTTTVAAGAWPNTGGLPGADATHFYVSNPSGALVVGASITGEGIPAGTTITAINGNYITLSSAAALGTNASTLSPGDSLSIQSGVIYGSYGYLSLKSDGTYQYFLTKDVPSNTQVNDYFSYKIQDSNGCTSTAVLQIQIQGDQVSPPVANADTGSVFEQPATSGTSPLTGNVVGNDTTASGTVSVTNAWLPTSAAVPGVVTTGTTSSNGLILQGQYGTLTIGANGSYSYVVNDSNATVDALRLPTDTLTDTFYYRVSNGATTPAYATSTLTITIKGANDAPVATADTVTAVEASGMNNTVPGLNPTGNVLLNDTDVDSGDTRTVTAIKAGSSTGTAGTVGGTTVGTYGTLTLNADGSYSYAVNNSNPSVEALKPGNTLTDTFTYTITDISGATSTASLTVTINGADDTVNIPDLFVNEGSPYAVFSIQSGAGQQLSLALTSGTAAVASGTPATDGSMDYGPAIEYWNGSAWTAYSASTNGGFVTVPADGVLLVRTAITPDTLLEAATGETFTLTATNKGGTAYTGTATILDDGTGTLFTAANPTTVNGVSTPVEDTTTLPDDDRPLTVNNVTVNEGSPYIVFQVGGVSEQWVKIAATNGTATTPDYGTQWQYFDGTAWVNYTAGSHVQIPVGTNTLLVRTSVAQDTPYETSESFTLRATNTGGGYATGTGTIVDDGSGNWFAADNTTGTPALPVSTVLDDDRPLSVNNVSVNEGSPYATFTVGGVAGQAVKLTLAAGSATTGADYTDALQYWNGSSWTNYTSGALVTIPTGSSTLLVRTAIVNDTIADNGETFTLTATNTGGTGTTGTGTIKDDGSGDWFAADNNTGTPSLPANTLLNDDRPLSVNNLTVNEGSPYATFTVTAAATGQMVKLALASGTATLASAGTAALDGTMDYGPALEYWNGSAWTSYTANTYVAVPAGGTSLLVRTAIVNDTPFDNGETFTLTATNTGGTGATGTATIKDDGSGTLFTAANPVTSGGTIAPAVDTTTPLNDDRPIAVNNVTVNEGSPYANFTVTTAAGQQVKLALANGTALAATTSPPATDGSMDYGPALEYWNGSSWTAYTANSYVTAPSNGTSLWVRTAIVNDTVMDNGQTFTLTATSTSGTTAIGFGTIKDDGTGDYFAANNNSGTPALPPGTVLDDDKALTVDSILVNEASPYATFTVTGSSGQLVKLTLGNTASTSDVDAILGTDTGNAGSGVPLQYFNGMSWVDYTPGSYVAIPTGDTTLLVRTAITNDTPYEGAETFTLTATNASNIGTTGTATIVDDGTGNIYKYSSPGSELPLNPGDAGYPALDDDRTPTVQGTTVNEASPYVVFQVTGIEGQKLSLTLGNTSVTTDKDATLGADTALGSTLEYFNGSSWLPYSGGFITLPSDGNQATTGGSVNVLVRLAVKQDTVYEGAETLTLTAATTSGAAATGTSTIIDDGTGGYFDATNNTFGSIVPANTVLDDDRAFAVNNVTVSETAGYAVFTVTGATGLQVRLDLQATTNAADNATLGTDLGPTLEYKDTSGNWVPYTANSYVAIPAGGLQVRTSVTRDSTVENPETFKLVATNSSGSTVTGAGTITDNLNPIAVADTATAIEAGTAAVANGGTGDTGTNTTGTNPGFASTLNVLTNDDATDGGTMTVTTALNPSVNLSATSVTSAGVNITGLYGTLNLKSDGTYTYTVDNTLAAVQALRVPTDTLADAFSYTVSDGYGGTSTSSLTITITGTNDAPISANDYNTAKESLEATVAAQYSSTDALGYKAVGNVLPNDTDVDASDTKTVVGLTGSASATTVSNSVLTFSSTQSNVKAGFYVFLGSAGSANQLLDASGNPIQVSPAYTGGTSLTLTGTVAAKGTVGSSYTLGGTETLFFASKPDGSGSTGTATIISATTSAGTTVALSAPAGSICVGMLVSGSAVSAGTTITGVTYGPDGSVKSVELSAPATLSGNSLTFSASAGNTVTGHYGTLKLDANGGYVYTPFANNPDLLDGQAVTDSFTYKMQDTLGATSTSALSITVLGSGTNDPNARDDTNTVTEAGGATAHTLATGNVLGGTGVSAGDVADTTPTGSLTVTGVRASGTSTLGSISAAGLYGTLTINSDGTYSYSLDEANPTVQALGPGATLKDTFNYQIQNGQVATDGTTKLQDVATLTITINGTNDAPVLDLNTANTGSSNYANTFTEGGSAVGLVTAAGLHTSGVHISDPDSGSFNNLTLSFSQAAFPDGSAEQLVANGATLGGTMILGGLGNGTTNGTLTLAGVVYDYTRVVSGGTVSFTFTKDNGATLSTAEIESLLDSLNYQNTSDNPTTGSSRVFTVTVQDSGGLTSNASTSTITVLPVNDAPVVDLDGATAGRNYSTSYVVGNAGVAIGSSGAVTDVDDTYIESATVVLTNAQAGDQLTLGSLPAGLTGTVGALSNGQITVTLTSTSANTITKAQYAAAINGILFSSTSASYQDRVLQVSVSDGELGSNTAQTTITMGPDNRPLTVTGTTVNEASPYVLFSVSGATGQNVTLELASTGTGNGSATLSVDTVNAGSNKPLQYLAGSTWTDYTPGSTLTLGSSPLLVRTGVVNDTPYEVPETLSLVARNDAGNTATGTSTIVDDGTGSYFAPTNTSTTPALPVGAVLDDDRPLSVNDVTVNEASPFIHFTVTGNAGQLVSLSLANSGNGTGHAVLGTDTGNANPLTGAQLQYFNGTSWLDYTPGSQVAIPASGNTLLVRTAIRQDTDYEGPEAFTLTATNTGGSNAVGTGTILDDGTGGYFAPGNNSGTSSVPSGTVLDDDRALTVDSITVNEGSPYAVFTVGGKEGQTVQLTLVSGTASAGGDYSTTLQYWDGSAWVNYTPGSYITIPSDGDLTSGEAANLLVRTAIVNDGFADNGEVFTLQATNATGTVKSGTGTITDDGSGTWYGSGNPVTATATTPALPQTVTPADPAATPVADPATTTVLNDDRALTVNDVIVNEGSPYAVFTVGGKEGQYVQLTLAQSNPVSAAAGSDYTNSLEYWNGTAWTAYTPGNVVAIPSNGNATANEAANLLVRVAITNDTTPDNGETFKLTATNTGGAAVTGTGTIMDDGTGTLFASAPGVNGVIAATSGTPTLPQTLTPANPATTPVVNPATTPVLNDDRTLTVDNVTVNEGSPYAVFTVGGKEGQYVQLGLAGLTATSGTDFTNAMEYWNGTAWTAYTSGTLVVMPSNGNNTPNETASLLVRVAITNDTTPDNGETFTLTATNTGGTAVAGTGTIKDDGTGTLFTAADPATVNGLPVPVVDTTGQLNDDRPLTVNSVTVNEGSPYAVFQVGAASGQLVKLVAANGTAQAVSGTVTADGSMDYGPALEYFNGTEWTGYTAGSYVAVPNGSSTLLVRTAIVNDSASDNNETFTLTATNTGGTGATGVGTIKDDGSGNWFAPDNNTGNPALPAGSVLNDDRALTVGNVTVNEGSPYAVFTVGGKEGQAVQLQLAAGTASANADYTNALEYWNGSAWTPYTVGSYVSIPSDGDAIASEAANLLVRVAITNDTLADNGETFTLTANSTGGTPTGGTGTITDDGTGTLFADAPVPASPSTPALPQTLTPVNPALTPVVDPTTSTVLNDDRPLSVGNVTVNEGSPYATFSVTAASNQLVKLALNAGTASMASGTPLTNGSMDFGPALEYWNGSSWTAYTAGTYVAVPTGSSSLLVRTAIVNDTLADNGETFTLTATNTGGTGATGTGTIKDDGTGDVFKYSSPTNAQPLTPTDPGYPSALDDDRPLSVNSINVNEASPYATFTVTGVTGQLVKLSLGNTASTTDVDATLGTDTGNAGVGAPLQYFNGTAWVDYTPGSLVPIPAGGNTLLVRTAVTNDTSNEGAETFTLNATNVSGAMATGIGTIKDDGTGDIFKYSGPGNPTPLAPTDPAYPVPDDDRTVQVNSIDVNEASPYAVFTVSGAAGQLVQLGLGNTSSTSDKDATLGTDTGNAGSAVPLQYFNGTGWVDYVAGSSVGINATGTLLVRTMVTNDTVYEGAETLTLTATNSSGSAATGVATIHDDGTGKVYPDNTTGNPDLSAALNDDRTVQINNLLVNEGSPYAVFTVTGSALQNVSLNLASGTATLGSDTAAANTLEWFNGTNWTSLGTPVTDASGQLLVRLAVRNDSSYEGAETFTLTAGIGAATATGTVTIVDDGTGDIYPDNTAGATDPKAPLDDDRSVQVSNLLVNEGSPFAVFTVTAAAGTFVKLGLQSDSNPATVDATLNTDTANAGNGVPLQYFDGTGWVSYAPGSTVQVPTLGTLLVRTAIVNDGSYEGPETFQLNATVTNSAGTTFGSSSYGTATILDNGTGAIYPDNTTGNTDPYATLNDDRTVQVNNLQVNEGSPYAVFTVTGTASQSVSLALSSGTAVVGTDTAAASTLEWFNGTSWTSSGTPATNASGLLLVRIAVTNDTVYEGAETVKLTATLGTASATGTATILDDGTGAIYPDNTTGNTDPNAPLNDDRAVQVNNIEVNEASPYAVFTVKPVAGSASTYVKLGLQNDSDPLTANATLNTDTGNTPLQYFDGSTWVDYVPGTPVLLPAAGLLVRTAIVNDTAFEGPETFQLNATVTNSTGATTGAASYGTATILDDGTGNLYPNNTTGNPDPNPVLDDDRSVQVNSIQVNEGSPYGVFTVTAQAGTWLRLGLQNDNDPTTANATLNTDTANPGSQALQYLSGSTWVNYVPGSAVQMPAGSSTLLVRTAIVNDSTYEGPETFVLNATVTNSTGSTTGAASYGTATILDDGTGSIYPDNTTGATTPNAALNDDRSVQVNNIAVNEGSPYAVFTVKTPVGAASTWVRLGLQNDSDPATANAILGTDTANAGTSVPLQYLNSSNQWVDYTPGTAVQLPAAGLLVRTRITNDSTYEGAETFQLSATVTNNTGTSTGAVSYGTATILDDGTGSIYPDNTTGLPDPAATPDNDRDTTPPTIAISSSKTALAAGETATITFTLSEASLDFNLADVVVSGGTLSNFQGSGTSYTATFTGGLTSDTRSVFVDNHAFSDAAGNFNADGADSNNRVTMSGTVVTPTIAVTASKSMLVGGEGALVTFTLSEASTDFGLSDITVVGGRLSNFQGTGTTYTATFTPSSCSTNGFVVVSSNKFSNASGVFNQDGLDLNNAVAFNSVASDTDTAQPTIAILSDHSSLQYGETTQVTFLLSHNSTDFNQSDVLVTGGTLSNFQGSGAMYTATFTPAAGVNSAMVFVDSGKFHSAAGTVNQDGLDTNNALSLLIGSHGCDDTFNINLSDVLAVTPSRCLGQYILKVEGDANDTVNLMDTGGSWTQAGTVRVDNQAYNLWTNTGNSQAYLLTDIDIHTVHANVH